MPDTIKSTPIRWGIMGAGRIARTFANDIQFAKNASLYGIASREQSKAQSFAKDFSIPAFYNSYEAILKDPKVDAVYIATPHSHHKNHAIAALRAGKHVLCEKPIAVNTAQFETMVASAKENNVLLMEAMWTRFLPSTLKIREVVQSKKLGKLKHAYLEFGFSGMGVGGDKGRLFNPNLAGGSLLDLGVYPVAFTLNITDQPVKSLSVKSQKYKTGVDIECIVDVVFEDDSTATLLSSLLEDRNSPGVIEYENGMILADNFWRSEKITINTMLRMKLPTSLAISNIGANAKTVVMVELTKA